MQDNLYIRSTERYYDRASFSRSLKEYHLGSSGGARELICETTKRGVQNCIDEVSNFGWEYVSCNKTNRQLFNRAAMKSTYSVFESSFNDDDLAIVQVKFEINNKISGIPGLFELQEEFFGKVRKFDTTDTKLENIPNFPLWLKILIGFGVLCCAFNPYGGILLLIISAFFIRKRRTKFASQIKNNKEKNRIIKEYDKSMKNILNEASSLLK